MSALILLTAALFLTGCSETLRVVKLQNNLLTEKFTTVGILQLPPSSYTTLHNIQPLRNKDFSISAQQALERAVVKKRKNWNIIYSANITATEPSLADAMAACREKGVDISDTATLEMMKKASSILGFRYLLLLESVSIKDASSAQSPAMAAFGSWVQLWDMSNGKLVYRARNVSRPVTYAEKDFDDRLSDALYDLFAEAIRPLPKL
ncbi:MAG: hypothetical protein JNL74_22915 [Fibrobacteres bacterium]|nr:hypothetical protein [Fibrobacterota bacterium]